MTINFNCKNLIIIKYPIGAGGKFISCILGLHPFVLPQERRLAQLKMKINENKNHALYGHRIGYEIARRIFAKKIQTNRHKEFGGIDFANWNGDLVEQEGLDIDQRVANDLWHELTNQKKYYFFQLERAEAKNPYQRYANRKTIYLKNYQWILQRRNRSFSDNMNLEDKYAFDMNSIKDCDSFKQEISNCLVYLQIPFDDTLFDYTENLRLNFLDTFDIGFDKKGELLT